MSKIGIIVASSNNNQKLAIELQKIAIELNYDSEIINLVDYNLPLYSTIEEEKNGIPESVLDLATKIIDLKAFIVVAPEYNWNDYAGLDVKGKVVMVMVNDPGFWIGDTSLFKGKAMTYYGRWTYKFEEAARQGAKGCLIIHNTAAASYPFSVVQNSFNTTRLKLDNRGKNIPNCDVIGWVPEKISHQLFAAAGFDSSLLVKANQPDFKAVPLGLQLSTTMNVKASFNKSSNVIAKITGTKRPEEVIIYTAHWDHLGIGRPDKLGDSIYNGALDNASGTAGLLEMARAFKNMKAKPERTIVFLAVTAEEQGLLGSAFYSENPIYPVNKTVANINMDGLNRFGKTKDMVVVGQGQSELEDYLKEPKADEDAWIMLGRAYHLCNKLDAANKAFNKFIELKFIANS